MSTVLIKAQNGVTVAVTVGQKIRYMKPGMFAGKFGNIVDITPDGMAVIKFEGVNHAQTLNPEFMVAA